MKTTKRIYVDLHVIQTVPPSCVNRDDTGSPKTAIYGGVKRARVSSQSWKKAIRDMFREELDESEMGIRTKKIVELVAQEICKIDSKVAQDKAFELAEKAVNACGIKTKDGEAKALFFLGVKQAQNLAKLILENDKLTKKETEKLLTKGHSIDIALFGRMVADDPSLNADASAQVAHSISTHKIENEYDYFTAVDDMAPKDNAGAGMIGVVEFNSSTLYRYATVAVHELNEELAGEREAVKKAVVTFAKAFITSMPTGKQNTFANRTLPDAVMVTIRADQPINMVGAFEDPIKAGQEGYAQKSINALLNYADEVYSTFAEKPEKTWFIGPKCEKKDMEQVRLSVFLDELGNAIDAELSAKK